MELQMDYPFKLWQLMMALGRVNQPFFLALILAWLNLKLKSEAVEAISHWEFYDPTLDGLEKTLEEIYRQFTSLTPQFFARAEHHLLSNRLLQFALAESKNISIEDRTELKQTLEKAKFLLADLKHPAYLQLRDRLLTIESEMPETERGWANGLACRCLLLESI
jgi:hypothetical protein